MYLSDFYSPGQNLEDSGQGSRLSGSCVLEGTGKFLCAPVMGYGGVEGAGGSLRTRGGSPRSVGPDNGIKQWLPISHPKWPTAISLWRNPDQPSHSGGL